MRFRRIDLTRFGIFTDRSLQLPRLASDLHIIVGPNEAGKSTLVSAIHAFLYGYSLKSEGLRFVPWHGTQYGGAIYVRLDNGEQYRLERDFQAESTSVYRDPGAMDVTSTYSPKKHGWISFAEQHLGLPSSVFRVSAIVSQGGAGPDRAQGQARREVAGAGSRGIGLAGLVFAMLHVQYLRADAAMALTLVGLILASLAFRFLTLRSGSLAPAIIAHIPINFTLPTEGNMLKIVLGIGALIVFRRSIGAELKIWGRTIWSAATLAVLPAILAIAALPAAAMLIPNGPYWVGGLSRGLLVVLHFLKRSAWN